MVDDGIAVERRINSSLGSSLVRACALWPPSLFQTGRFFRLLHCEWGQNRAGAGRIQRGHTAPPESEAIILGVDAGELHVINGRS